MWFAFDTQIGRDVVIEPNVFFGTGVSIADGAVIHGFSHIEGATIGAEAEVGPFARLRPGAVLGEKSKIGNFVEMKKAILGPGAKASHLTYLGDAEVGAGANIGAGTITCNYDGFLKYKTVIGAGAFIGSNSALVAPVTIGAGAIVGAGSVITADVEADALALGRGKQEGNPPWLGKALPRRQCGAKEGREEEVTLTPLPEREGGDLNMCGIVGILGKGPVADRLLDGLKRLEYRGAMYSGSASAPCMTANSIAAAPPAS